MAKSIKRPRDVNQLAKSIVDEATKEKEPEKAADPEEALRKAAAAALGRAGGKKGGPARKAALSPDRRTEIAREAARKRWGK